ncbi:hypothetical protein [Natronorarus salvus]|uniref:hypothetical protein n=1 Tax=Natronorarus salvus TaxID=3117733 RepID=UPI002F26DB00
MSATDADGEEMPDRAREDARSAEAAANLLDRRSQLFIALRVLEGEGTKPAKRDEIRECCGDLFGDRPWPHHINARMRELVDRGLVRRVEPEATSKQHRYELTDLGREMAERVGWGTFDE